MSQNKEKCPVQHCFDVILETFVRMWLFLKNKNIVNLRKPVFIKKAASNAGATVRKYFTTQMSIHTV